MLRLSPAHDFWTTIITEENLNLCHMMKPAKHDSLSLIWRSPVGGGMEADTGACLVSFPGGSFLPGRTSILGIHE